jgi:hypothetical protein
VQSAAKPLTPTVRNHFELDELEVSTNPVRDGGAECRHISGLEAYAGRRTAIRLRARSRRVESCDVF